MRICQAKEDGATTRPRNGVPRGGGPSIWWYMRMGIFMLTTSGLHTVQVGVNATTSYQLFVSAAFDDASLV